MNRNLNTVSGVHVCVCVRLCHWYVVLQERPALLWNSQRDVPADCSYRNSESRTTLHSFWPSVLEQSLIYSQCTHTCFHTLDWVMQLSSGWNRFMRLSGSWLINIEVTVHLVNHTHLTGLLYSYLTRCATWSTTQLKEQWIWDLWASCKKMKVS